MIEIWRLFILQNQLLHKRLHAMVKSGPFHGDHISLELGQLTEYLYFIWVKEDFKATHDHIRPHLMTSRRNVLFI